MKRIVLATLAAGCTQNADIGQGQPVACMPDGGSAADATGMLTNPNTQAHFEFGNPTLTLQQQPLRVVMTSPGNLAGTMTINFLCGQPTVDAYDVEGVSQQTIDCPLSVATAFTAPEGAAVTFADASSGTLVIDQNVGCLAGRFDVRFDDPRTVNLGGSNGGITGWFSLAWQ